MKFDGNYRIETWQKEVDGQTVRSSFVVDDEQVTATYGLWSEILTELGFSRVDA